MKLLASIALIVFSSLSLAKNEKNAKIISAPKKTIVWAFTSTSSMIAADIKGNIVNEKNILFRLYTDGMQEYEHTTFIGTVPRIESELQSDKLVCYPGSSEAERRKQFSYLTSQYVQPSPVLVVKKELADKLLKNNKHGITLASLLTDEKLVGLVAQSRSFGTKIDIILKTHPEHMTTGVFNALGPNVIQMISAGRADYTIEYPFIINDLKESHTIDESIVSLPMIDAGPTITQYLACSKTKDGLDVIKIADKIIRKNVSRPEYWKGILLSVPEGHQVEFQKHIDKFIKSRIKKSEIIK